MVDAPDGLVEVEPQESEVSTSGNGKTGAESDTANGASKRASKRRGRKRRSRRPSRRAPSGGEESDGSPSKLAPFPRTTFEDALALGLAIQSHAAGQPIRRSTLFEKLNKSPDSGPTRTLITNSGKYGITKGSYKADVLSLTPSGDQATNPEVSQAASLTARFELAIRGIPAFNFLYASLKEKRVPSPEVMRDSLAGAKVDEGHRKECVELFLENAKFLGLLRTSAGAERLASIEQVLDTMSTGTEHAPTTPTIALARQTGVVGTSVPDTVKSNSLEKVCFFIAPISDEGSEERKYSDMVLESLITRALEGEDFAIIRADKIGDPGMISEQVINYLLRARLVIADLSFHNPNVFYELAIRHMTGLPTVHLIRNQDSIPFDLKDFRTIVIDTADKYNLVAKLDTYRAEIANHVRIALKTGAEASNPVRVFARSLVVKIGD
jgi:hypothetical protein